MAVAEVAARGIVVELLTVQVARVVVASAAVQIAILEELARQILEEAQAVPV